MKFFIFPIISLINFLKLDNIIIIAHSLGAFIAAHLSSYVKEKLLGVFLVGAAGFTNRDMSKNETEALVETFTKKWDVKNPKFLETLRYYTFEKKMPIFNYLPKSMTK